MKIANHTFFITGACSGLGKATAQYLATQNANIVVADINAMVGQAITTELGEHGLFVTMDITSQNQILSALETAKKHFGQLHGLINCAGILIAARILGKDGELFNLENFKQCLDVNLTGSFNMIRLIIPLLKNNPANDDGERGIIINTSSIAAFEGQIGQAAYAASKAGIIGMTLPIARELAAYGIRVMTIAPGVFETPLFASLNAAKRQALEQQTPFPPRLGKPSEYAKLTRHIIENTMLNGSVIRLDGALRLH